MKLFEYFIGSSMDRDLIKATLRHSRNWENSHRGGTGSGKRSIPANEEIYLSRSERGEVKLCPCARVKLGLWSIRAGGGTLRRLIKADERESTDDDLATRLRLAAEIDSRYSVVRRNIEADVCDLPVNVDSRFILGSQTNRYVIIASFGIQAFQV